MTHDDHHLQHTPSAPSGLRARLGLSRTRVGHLIQLSALSIVVGIIMQLTATTHVIQSLDWSTLKAVAPAVLTYGALLATSAFLSTRDGTSKDQPVLPDEITIRTPISPLGIGNIICHAMPVLLLPILTAMVIDFIQSF